MSSEGGKDNESPVLEAIPLTDMLWDFRQDVSLAALLVASKLEDTLKKLKDIQIAGHHVKVSLEGASLPPEPDLHVCSEHMLLSLKVVSKHCGHSSLLAYFPQVIDYERGKLIGIERLILETVSFSFNLHFGAPPGAGAEVQPPIAHDVFSYIIKIAQHMQRQSTLQRLVSVCQ